MLYHFSELFFINYSYENYIIIKIIKIGKLGKRK